mgnify:CR=1 FL=1
MATVLKWVHSIYRSAMPSSNFIQCLQVSLSIQTVQKDAHHSLLRNSSSNAHFKYTPMVMLNNQA